MSTEATPLPTTSTPSANGTALPDDLSLCHRMIRELLDTNHQLQRRTGQLEHRLDQLLRRLFGPRAEKLDPNQLKLFLDAAAPGDAPPSEPSPSPSDDNGDAAAKRKRNGHGRKKLPANLPRVPVVHDLADAEKPCPDCGHGRAQIGEEITEQLDYQPASLYVVEHHRCKYACPRCEAQVQLAALPPQPIAKGLPGPGLVAHVGVSKYCDHVPLHRAERILARHGVEVSRQTMSDWMAFAALLLTPVVDRMKERILQSLVIHTDDTVIPVLDPDRDHAKPGRMWAYCGVRGHPLVVFDYTPDRSRAGPAEWLKSYRGYLHADAYGGYDHLFMPGGPLVEVACWAHARRKFFEAKETAPAAAHAALARIRQLYDVEHRADQRIAVARADAERGGAGFSDAQADAIRREVRQVEARPLLAEFRMWLESERGQALPKSPIAVAITYALNQWDALGRYTDEGFLAIDNNLAERTLRAVAIGRKNWLFAGSDNGGRTAAIWFSLTASCRNLKRDPFAYLRDLLTRLPALTAAHPDGIPAALLDPLLPDRWTPPSTVAAVAAVP